MSLTNKEGDGALTDQIHAHSTVEFNVEKAASDIKEYGVAGMGFLFSKAECDLILQTHGGSFFIDQCLLVCLQEARSDELKKNTALYSSTLKRIFTILNDASYPYQPELFLHVLEFFFQHWNSSVDAIRHEVTDIFQLLVDNHFFSNCEQCSKRIECMWMESIVETMFDLYSPAKARFKCVMIMLKKYPTCFNRITDSFIGYLYSFIANSSQIHRISDILALDLEKSKHRWSYHISRIIKFLISDFTPVRQAIKERVIPTFMKNTLIKDEFLEQLMISLKDIKKDELGLEALLTMTSFAIHFQKKCKVYKTWTSYIPVETMKMAVLHSAINVRLSAWNVLCDHPKKTEPYTKQDLELMKVFFMTNMTEQSPFYRQKMLNTLRKAFSRLACVGELYLKKKISDEDGMLNCCNQFVGYLIQLSFDCLVPEANFNRRVMALTILSYIFKEEYLKKGEKNMFHADLRLSYRLTPDRFNRLVGVLADSFQLCQSMALELLKTLHFSIDLNWTEFHQETEQMLSSRKSHHTQSAAYRVLLFIHHYPDQKKSLLKKMISTCSQNTSKAREDLIQITSNCLHPFLNSIYLLLQEVNFLLMSPEDEVYWRQICNKQLLPLCFEVSQVVSPVVHSSSPEGYMPPCLLERLAGPAGSTTTILHAETSQLLLACCWRAHKHVSQILSWMAVKLCALPIPHLSRYEVNRIAEYFWLQLTECKHFGAFEGAVESFSALCTFLWKNPSHCDLSPQLWLDQILEALTGEKDFDNLCSTRRSAGLPHLVVSILNTQPQLEEHNPGQTIRRTLIALLAMEGKSLTQRVHSLNVLKAVFSCSSLSDRIAEGLEWAVRVAISGSAASAWSERNSSAQLAAALRERIFGVTRTQQRQLSVDPKNKISSYEFFSRYPSLFEFFISHLQSDLDEFSLFPALIFLCHIFPSTQMHQYNPAPFIPLLLKILLSCKADKLRRLSAATIFALSQPQDHEYLLAWMNTCEFHNKLIGTQTTAKQNQIHGVLLLMKYFLIGRNDGHHRHVIQDLVKKFEPECLCDANLKILLALYKELFIPLVTELDPKKYTMSRPLIFELIVRANPHATYACAKFEESLTYRLGVYEAVYVLSSPHIHQHVKLHISLLNDLLVEGLQEEDYVRILNVLTQQRKKFLPKIKKVLALRLRHCLRTKHFKMPSSISMAHSLLLELETSTKNLEPITVEENPETTSETNVKEFWEFIEMSIDIEDDEAKAVAIEGGVKMLLRDVNNSHLYLMSRFLQDEEAKIRLMAARYLTPLTCACGFPLNPEVLRRWIASRVQKSGIEISASSKNEETKAEPARCSELFDTSIQNQFYEEKDFGDFVDVEAVLKQIIDMTLSSNKSQYLCTVDGYQIYLQQF